MGLWITSVDFSILDFIQEHIQCGFLDTIMPYITALANYGIIWIALTVVLLCFKKTRKLGLAMGVALIIQSVTINNIIKPIVARPRPFEINTAIELLIAAPTDYSFPSGHTGASFAVVSAMFFGKNKWWPEVLVLALVIAFSRLYLYVHYPSDVLVGALIGIFAGWLSCVIILRNERRHVLPVRS